MTDKTKNDEKVKNDDRKVEWSFDFADFGESIQRLFDSLAGEEELQTSEYFVGKNDATSAKIKLHYSVGKGSLKAMAANSDDLMEAIISHVGELEFKDNHEPDRKITLKQKTKISASLAPIKRGFRAFGSRDDLLWDVSLSPDVPLSLDIHGGVGPIDLNLTSLQVRKLKVDAGVGTVKLVLPVQDAHMEADVDSGVGQTKIFIPDNADVSLDIDGGVGAVEVTIPPNAAVQIKGDTGIGAINVPKSLKRLSKKEFMGGGLWQSDGFDLAERRIVIRYDGGVGALNVREAEVV